MTQSTQHSYDSLEINRDYLNINDWLFRDARKKAINTLALRPGDCVLDLFSGTGVNFKPIFDEVGQSGSVIAIDNSIKMLSRAHRRVKKEGLQRDHITFIQGDLLNIPFNYFSTILKQGNLPKLLITFGLSQFKNHDEICRNLFCALPEGTRFTIMEGDCRAKEQGAWLLDLVGQSNCHRCVYESIKYWASDYRVAWYKPPFKYIKGSIVVASGAIRKTVSILN